MPAHLRPPERRRRAGSVRNADRAGPAHLRPPEGRPARIVGALAVAVGIAMIVLAGFNGHPADERTTQLVQPATEASSEPTVLGSDTERTTVPDAPPASAAGFTTTTTATTDGDPGDGGGSVVTSPQLSPSPTLGPPVSVTRPPRPRPTTTTTTTAPITTTTAEATTTTEDTTTTTEA